MKKKKADVGKINVSKAESPQGQGILRLAELPDEQRLEPEQVCEWLGIKKRSLVKLALEKKIGSVKTLASRRIFLVRHVRAYLAKNDTLTESERAEEFVAQKLRQRARRKKGVKS